MTGNGGRVVLGWAKLRAARRLHYFPRDSSRSLCGGWDYSAPLVVIISGAVALPTCKKCLAELEKRMKQ